MSRAMNAQEWEAFESVARQFCELRAEYNRRKAAGTLGGELGNRMVQTLNALELEIDRMKSRNELARARARRAACPAPELALLRKAQ